MKAMEFKETKLLPSAKYLEKQQIILQKRHHQKNPKYQKPDGGTKNRRSQRPA